MYFRPCRSRRTCSRSAHAENAVLRTCNGHTDEKNHDSLVVERVAEIAETDDLHISPFREDGRTYVTPTWIWSVVVEDGLYVRAYNGRQSRWYQAAIQQKAGRIRAAGMTKEVLFEPIDGPINSRIDGACRRKYRGSPYRAPIIGAHARSATVRVLPRNAAE